MQAPKAAENFRCLCTGERGKGKKSGVPLHYQGVPFHRIATGFVCQGGDIVKGDGSGGDSIYGGSFNDEKPGLKLKHDAAGVCRRCNAAAVSMALLFLKTSYQHITAVVMHPRVVHLQVVSMANSGKNSNTSGFFITLAPAPQCDGKHVILGWVVEGLDIVQRIGERLACSLTGFAGGAGSHTGCSSRCAV